MRQVANAFCWSILWATGACAATTPTPYDVRQAIAHSGPRKAVTDLDAAGQLDPVLDNIGKGSADWIAIAPLLAPGTDGADATGIEVSMARALLVNPAAVLRNAEPEGASYNLISISSVCGIPFIEATAAFIADYQKHAIAALTTVHDTKLAKRKAECQKALE